MAVDLDTLPQLIEPVARELLGEPNRALSSKTELRYGNHGSLAVDLGKGTYFDHEAQEGGGVLDLITRETGLRGGEREEWIGSRYPDVIVSKPNGKQHGKAPLGIEVGHYNYVDETGSLLFQVVRFEPKTFRQRRPARPADPPQKVHSGWVWTARDVRQVPYRLPELIEAIDNVVFVVEGEKDADNLITIGAPATCNAGGVGKWSDALNDFFRDADVVVIQDNDPQARKPSGELRFHPDGRPVYPGQDHARVVCTQLSVVAQRVRLLDLKEDWPDMPLKGDVTDWIAHGGTIETLNALVEHAPEWSPELPGPEPEIVEPPAPKLLFIDMRAWDGVPVPERRWLVRDCIPARNVTLLSGAGGIGKTLLAQQLAVATVLARDWIGMLPEPMGPGPVMLLSAEDDEDEIHFRLDQIVRSYGASFRDLGDLHVTSLAGKDAVLATINNKGMIERTPLYAELREKALAIRPRWIGIDTAADVFIVDERDRSQVRQCLSLLRGLALDIDTAVLLLSHPSLTGLSTGTGLSGSTAWNNSVRSRLYLRSPKKGEAGGPDDDDVDASEDEAPQSVYRVLELMKANYGPSGNKVPLIWKDGMLIKTPSATAVVSPVQKAARDQDVRAIFCTLLKRFNERDETVSHKPAARNYAPTLFAERPETAALNRSKNARRKFLEKAMRELLDTNDIGIGMGPMRMRPSKRAECLYGGRRML